jgi:tRNA U34 5-carboxymethylaminomethyl modifying enzyme MnmG/GidA
METSLRVQVLDLNLESHESVCGAALQVGKNGIAHLLVLSSGGFLGIYTVP